MKCNKNFVEHIIYMFNLGTLIERPIQFKLSRKNTIYRIKTTQGYFVIKIIKPYQNINFKQLIESEKLVNQIKHKLPVVSAVMNNNRTGIKIADSVVFVFPYVKGKCLPADRIQLHHVKCIALALKTLHGIRFNKIKEIKEIKKRKQEFKALDFTKYQKLLPKTLQIKLNPLMNLIEHINHQIKLNKPILSKSLKITHGDLDPYNVLWEKNNFTILDWESARVANRYKDILATALYWSFDACYKIRSSHCKKFLSVYGTYFSPAQFEAAFFAFLYDWLVWLEFLFDRICKEQNLQFNKFKKEAMKTMETLPKVFKQKDKIKKWVIRQGEIPKKHFLQRGIL